MGTDLAARIAEEVMLVVSLPTPFSATKLAAAIRPIVEANDAEILAEPSPVDEGEVAKACHFEMRQRGCLDDQAERLGDPLAIITRHIAVAIAERDRLQVAVEEARPVMEYVHLWGNDTMRALAQAWLARNAKETP